MKPILFVLFPLFFVSQSAFSACPTVVQGKTYEFERCPLINYRFGIASIYQTTPVHIETDQFTGTVSGSITFSLAKESGRDVLRFYHVELLESTSVVINGQATTAAKGRIDFSREGFLSELAITSPVTFSFSNNSIPFNGPLKLSSNNRLGTGRIDGQFRFVLASGETLSLSGGTYDLGRISSQLEEAASVTVQGKAIKITGPVRFFPESAKLLTLTSTENVNLKAVKNSSLEWWKGGSPITLCGDLVCAGRSLRPFQIKSWLVNLQFPSETFITWTNGNGSVSLIGAAFDKPISARICGWRVPDFCQNLTFEKYFSIEGDRYHTVMSYEKNKNVTWSSINPGHSYERPLPKWKDQPHRDAARKGLCGVLISPMTYFVMMGAIHERHPRINWYETPPWWWNQSDQPQYHCKTE